MLFLLKRRADTSLLLLVVLAGLGLLLRHLAGGPPVIFDGRTLFFGLAAFGIVLASDATLHGLFCLTLADAYRRRHQELVEVFRGQPRAAMFSGALAAGLGEELVFRGLGTNLCYLTAAAIVFGLLHHIRSSLWPFTLWAIWQGVLLGGALYVTGNLAVSITAHFLHDLAGFQIFRYLNQQAR